MTKRNVNINPERIEDEVLREMITEIKEEMERETLSDWQGNHFEVTLNAGDNEIGHGLGFIPKDIWITYLSNQLAYVRIQYNLTTNENFTLYTSSAPGLVVRGFVGTYSTET